MDIASDSISENHQVFPVPVVELANEAGIHVYATDKLEDSQSGLIRKEGDSYAIYVNERHPLQRQRFTIAHELMHFKLHKDRLDNGTEFIDSEKRVYELRRATEAMTDEQKRMEREADHAAAEFLMPESKFREVFERASTLDEVADFFGVSTSAASIRAKEVLDIYTI